MAKRPNDPCPTPGGWVLNLQTKLLLIFLALTMAPLLIVGWFSLQLTEQLIVSMVVRQLENVAADKAALLERWLDERKADLQVAAGTFWLQTMNPARMAPYLDLVRRHYGVYKELTVVDTGGRQVVHSREGEPADDPGGRQRLVVRQELFTSEITYAPDEKESSFLLAAPIFDQDGRLAGTLYGRVGTNKIIFFVLNVSLGKTGECYLVDKDGRFLAHKEPHRILTQNISQSDSFRKIFAKGDRKQSYRDYRGVAVLGASLKIGGTDWYIVVEQDREEAFESVAHLKRLIFLTVLLCIASALMLTWMVSYHIVGPIRKLSEYARLIANSPNPGAIGALERRDEIGLLYRAVADMSRKLQERQNHLEQKVGMREAELKETDMILKKTQLMAERSEKFAALGRMSAAVAHEIRTPLTSIKLFLESVQAEIDHPDEYEEDVRIALNQIGRIEATINRFLDFAKPRDLVFLEIDLAELIGELMVMVRPQVNRQECFLHIAIEEDLPAIVGDRRLLAEALINLLVNALEAMPVHGTLTIKACRAGCEVNGRAIPCVQVDIGDTGHGMADDQIDKIFEPFFTTKATGTGLGLPLVLNTIRNHGGQIRVASQIDNGTTFSLYLPLNRHQPISEYHGKNIAHR
jgi:signal transduction histidine kinase